METKFQTSFIPKQPVTDTARPRTSAASLVFLVSFILFMASLAAAGAVFIYGQVITKNINDGKVTLQRNKNAFDPTTISELTRLNDRINATYGLLKNHKSVSTFFQVLSNTTLKTVRFTDFTYSSVGDKITVSMNGQAFNYETVALQSKAFTDPALKNVFKSPLFGDLTLDALGNVSFGFSTSIDPFLVNYYKLKTEELNAGQATAAEAPAPAEQTGLSGNTQGFVQTSPTTQQ
jgi:hypothetical protein